METNLSRLQWCSAAASLQLQPRCDCPDFACMWVDDGTKGVMVLKPIHLAAAYETAACSALTNRAPTSSYTGNNLIPSSVLASANPKNNM